MLRQAKESMLSIHPIKYDRNGQNARRRAKSGTSHKRQRSDGTNLVMCFNQNDFVIWNIATLNAYWQTVYVYARSIQYAETSQVSVKLLQLFQAQATLNEPATANGINFQAVVKRKGFKGLVSSSYSSATEFTTAITDRLRE